MISRTFTIHNKAGIHLKPAAALCTEATKYRCTVRLQSQHASINAKSVLNVLSACVKFQDEIILTCEGEDEELAMENIGRLIQDGLGE